MTTQIFFTHALHCAMYSIEIQPKHTAQASLATCPACSKIYLHQHMFVLFGQDICLVHNSKPCLHACAVHFASAATITRRKCCPFIGYTTDQSDRNHNFNCAQSSVDKTYQRCYANCHMYRQPVNQCSCTSLLHLCWLVASNK